MPNKELTPNAIKQLCKELKITNNFSLNGALHDEINAVITSPTIDNISKLFKDHSKLLTSLQVTPLDTLFKVT